MTTRDRLLSALRETGRYDTPATSAYGLRDRMLGRFDSYYYMHLFHIIFHAAFQTHLRGRFKATDWQSRSLDTTVLIERCGGQLHLSGWQHARQTRRPVVYTANHMSLLETFVLPGLLMDLGPVSVVVKDSLLRYPVFGAVMRGLKPISVARQNPREDLRTVLEQGTTLLAQGTSVLLFPQSTRNVVFDPTRFNSLGAKLAHRAGVPILPLALKTNFMGTGRWFRDFGPIDRRLPVHIAMGEHLSATDPKTAHRHNLEFLERTLPQWGIPVNPTDKEIPA